MQALKQRFEIVGNSLVFDRALETAIRVAHTDLSVLITGESGSGKEVFSKIIHHGSPRKHANFLAVNCGAIPEGTIDSELFGHEKGSFTGATETRKGYFEIADKGTIFLDEVAELPLQTQVRLLRVLETGEFIKVGTSTVQKTDVRVVAATNVNIQKAIAKGRFREDLYYRLNTVPIFVPPLRERGGDILLLFRKFASDFSNKYKVPTIRLTETAQQIAVGYHWPGNIRQLKNVTEQISILETDRQITDTILTKYLPNSNYENVPIVLENNSNQHQNTALEALVYELRYEVNQIKTVLSQIINSNISSTYETPKAITYQPNKEPNTVEENALDLSDNEKILIVKSLEKFRGRRKEAARELGISERTLYRKIKDYNIDL